MPEPGSRTEDDYGREVDRFWQESLAWVLDHLSIGALAEIAELDEPCGIADPIIRRARERVPDSMRKAEQS